MNRPVLGTVSILALLGGGLYFAWNYKDTPSQNIRTNYEKAAARSAIQSWLDLPLPNSAAGVHCGVENIGNTKLVYACFDIPEVELPALFDQPRLPKYSELTNDIPLLQAMGSLSDPQRTWWDVHLLQTAKCAQKSGVRNVAPATLKWRSQVCVASSGEMKRVYIAFSEEPEVAK